MEASPPHLHIMQTIPPQSHPPPIQYESAPPPIVSPTLSPSSDPANVVPPAPPFPGKPATLAQVYAAHGGGSIDPSSLTSRSGGAQTVRERTTHSREVHDTQAILPTHQSSGVMLDESWELGGGAPASTTTALTGRPLEATDMVVKGQDGKAFRVHVQAMPEPQSRQTVIDSRVSNVVSRMRTGMPTADAGSVATRTHVRTVAPVREDTPDEQSGRARRATLAASKRGDVSHSATHLVELSRADEYMEARPSSLYDGLNVRVHTEEARSRLEDTNRHLLDQAPSLVPRSGPGGEAGGEVIGPDRSGCHESPPATGEELPERTHASTGPDRADVPQRPSHGIATRVGGCRKRVVDNGDPSLATASHGSGSAAGPLLGRVRASRATSGLHAASSGSLLLSAHAASASAHRPEVVPSARRETASGRIASNLNEELLVNARPCCVGKTGRRNVERSLAPPPPVFRGASLAAQGAWREGCQWTRGGDTSFAVPEGEARALMGMREAFGATDASSCLLAPVARAGGADAASVPTDRFAAGGASVGGGAGIGAAEGGARCAAFASPRRSDDADVGAASLKRGARGGNGPSGEADAAPPLCAELVHRSTFAGVREEWETRPVGRFRYDATAPALLPLTCDARLTHGGGSGRGGGEGEAALRDGVAFLTKREAATPAPDRLTSRREDSDSLAFPVAGEGVRMVSGGAMQWSGAPLLPQRETAEGAC